MTGEYKAFLRAQQKDITPVCFLRENGLAIVQEVKPNEDPYTWQEDLRLAGNQLCQPLVSTKLTA